jgi:zinc D-Ala-D-Ala carboxypeptidase
MKHFKITEFDSPDAKGSGANMDVTFLRMLDRAREIADTSFLINSGYRTREHTERLIKRGYQASRNSSHHIGKAADIAVSPQTRGQILDGCIAAGFKRIGIANTFIHVDNDDKKNSPTVWIYGNVDKRIVEWAEKRLGIKSIQI